MSKGRGKKLGLKFTHNLIGDNLNNESAFTVKGKEYQYVNGPDKNGSIVDVMYDVESVESYPIPTIWETDGHRTLETMLDELSVNETKAYSVTSGRSISGSVSVNVGDIMLATISHRGTLSLPSGWEVIYESEEIGSSQKLVFATKTSSVNGQEILNVSNSVSNRMYLNLISISNVNSIVYDESYTVIEKETVTEIEVPDKKAEDMLIWGVTANIWATGYSDPWRTTPDNLEIVSSGTEPRQANFIDILDSNTSEARAFIPRVRTTAAVAAVKLIQNYDPSFIYESEAIESTGPTKVNWDSYMPENTNVKIEYTTGVEQGEWTEVNHADIVDSDTNIWLRATLTTDDDTVTPILRKLWLEVPAPEDTLLLTVNDSNRFNNVIGDITVMYDESIGNLVGRGGPVASFEHSFTPEDLEPLPNPGHSERVGAKVGQFDIELKEIQYLDVVSESHVVGASVGETTISLKDVNNINP